MTTTSAMALAAAIFVLSILLGSAQVQAQDLRAGRALFAQCSACHSIDGTNGAGPSLKGIFGRQAGSLSGFRYSRAMKNAGYAWDAHLLDTYIANPQTAMPGNLMPFSGVSDAMQRADLIAYLMTLQ